MISTSVLTAFIFAAAAELLLPIIILVVLGIRKKLSGVPALLGFAAFFVSQILLRIPILQALGTQSWFKAFALNTIPYVMMLSVTAGLFEESARQLCAGCFLKKHRSFQDALSFGLGHGFCEVILLTGMAQINNIIYSVMINNGSFQKLTASLPAAQSQQLLTAMLSVKPEAVYLGILERVCAVTFHVFASILIFKGAREHKIRYYFLAILAHTALNIGSVLLTKYVNMLAGEGFALLFAAAAFFLILQMKKSYSATDLPAAEPEA
ncbi:MAG TPA: YhfC family glutamic-type intramembrane protease [Caproiciproducens sp.]|nr:YhfC family glutamic-type intramembrane protease [Caproiciproducens sp.]